MLEINNTTNTLVNLDKFLNYAPGLSAASNLIDMFLHYVVRPCIGETDLKTNHYFAHLETKYFVNPEDPYDVSKPWTKYLIYIIPVIGNIWAAWQDYNRGEQAKDAEKLFLNNPLDGTWEGKKHAKEIEAHPELFLNNGLLDNHATLYRDAQFYGSAEGAYRLGCLSLRELDSEKTNEVPQEAMKYLRYAAAKGHVQANLKLRELSKLDS